MRLNIRLVRAEHCFPIELLLDIPVEMSHKSLPLWSGIVGLLKTFKAFLDQFRLLSGYSIKFMMDLFHLFSL